MTEFVTTWYLQMLSKDFFKPKYLEDEELEVVEVKIKDYRYNRFLYSLVGEQWSWTDKLKWRDEEWITYAENENLHTYVGYYSGVPAGYYELEWQEGENIEISYFGLSPMFIGRGIGGHLLSHAIASAWALNPKRVWVHTCSKDHPAALNNYKARGMELFSTTINEV